VHHIVGFRHRFPQSSAPVRKKRNDGKKRAICQNGGMKKTQQLLGSKKFGQNLKKIIAWTPALNS
jgi:hypothetical protein